MRNYCFFPAHEVNWRCQVRQYRAQRGFKTMEYSIAQAAERAHLTVHTMRYYDKEGLLPFIHRTQSGARIFTESDMEWLGLIGCLKNADMPLKDIRTFIEWCLQGDATLEQRRDMLLGLQQTALEKMRRIQNSLNTLDRKINYYNRACAAGSEAAARKTC